MVTTHRLLLLPFHSFDYCSIAFVVLIPKPKTHCKLTLTKNMSQFSRTINASVMVLHEIRASHLFIILKYITYQMTLLLGSKAGQPGSNLKAGLWLLAVGNNAPGQWLTWGHPQIQGEWEGQHNDEWTLTLLLGTNLLLFSFCSHASVGQCAAALC